MRLQKFLNEGRSKKMNRREVVTSLANDASQAVERYNKGYEIGRSSNTPGPYLHVKSTGSRRSAFAEGNYYTMILNNHPMGRNYPKREIICSGGTGERAREHGSAYTYNVFPFNGAKIGICSEDDVGNSFLILKDFDLNDANEFNRGIYDLYIDEDENGSKFSKIAKEYNFDESDDDLIKERLKKFNNLYEFITYAMNPKENGFKVQKMSQYSISRAYDVEVGTDADCILIDSIHTEGLIEDINAI